MSQKNESVRQSRPASGQQNGLAQFTWLGHTYRISAYKGSIKNADWLDNPQRRRKLVNTVVLNRTDGPTNQRESMLEFLRCYLAITYAGALCKCTC